MPEVDANEPDAGTRNDSDPSPAPDESPVGKGFVGLGGIVAITAYLALLTLFLFYIEIKIWPVVPLGQPLGPSQGQSSAALQSTSPTSAGNPLSGTSKTFSPTPSDAQGQPSGGTGLAAPAQAPPVKFFWGERPYLIGDEARLFFIVIVAGALGSLLRALRSVSWYVGNRKLVWSWATMYILLPFTGAVLAIIFYVTIRGGFLPQSTLPNLSPYAFAALGSLVGLFNQEAVLKLKQVAETVFTKGEPGKDHVGAAPKATAVLPASGPAAGGTQLTITGANFSSGAKVTIGGVPAISVQTVTSTSIIATTPARAAGPADVDIEVANPDGQKAVLSGGYKYT